jgi:5-methylcytosine-specific restriction endonuclease McrA
MPREVPEWIGKTPDTPVPDRVRRRVLERHDHICYLSGIEIRPGDTWEIEHKVALIEGGENRENNLAPALTKYHKIKTKAEMARKKKNNRVKNKHFGITRPKNPMPGSRDSKWKKTVNGGWVRREQ